MLLAQSMPSPRRHRLQPELAGNFKYLKGEHHYPST